MMTHEEARRLAAEARERSKGGPASDMTLRDYFAAKAMQGMLAHHGVLQNKKQAENDAVGATHAYLIADAMLKAREA